MVNFLHNFTALAGTFTLTRIFDFQGHLVTLSQNQVFNGAAIVSFPPTSGALNQEWFIDPLPANDGTFIMQNWLGNFFSAADAGQGNGDHSPAVAAPSSNVALATVFKMQTVGSGPQVNFIQALGSDTSFDFFLVNAENCLPMNEDNYGETHGAEFIHANLPQFNLCKLSEGQENSRPRIELVMADYATKFEAPTNMSIVPSRDKNIQQSGWPRSGSL
ncbi:hypothetical protein B0H19DRAFT_1083211 [Mycena capillaripes]|nr:hypothetical protein B0H19DRAFT_1083211 [Mycena capillaripes]